MGQMFWKRWECCCNLETWWLGSICVPEIPTCVTCTENMRPCMASSLKTCHCARRCMTVCFCSCVLWLTSFQCYGWPTKDHACVFEVRMKFVYPLLECFSPSRVYFLWMYVYPFVHVYRFDVLLHAYACICVLRNVRIFMRVYVKGESISSMTSPVGSESGFTRTHIDTHIHAIYTSQRRIYLFLGITRGQWVSKNSHIHTLLNTRSIHHAHTYTHHTLTHTQYVPLKGASISSMASPVGSESGFRVHDIRRQTRHYSTIMAQMLSSRSNYNLETGQITTTRSKIDDESSINMQTISARERTKEIQVYPFEDEGLLQAACEAAAMGDDDFGDPHRSMLVRLGRRVIASGPGMCVYGSRMCIWESGFYVCIVMCVSELS